MRTHDPDQWRKRFRNVLDREKIIDFGRPLSLWMHFKQERVQALNQVGATVLTMGKFWFLYLMYCNAERLQQRIEIKSDNALLKNH